jgi:hypothetical protein
LDATLPPPPLSSISLPLPVPLSHSLSHSWCPYKHLTWKDTHAIYWRSLWLEKPRPGDGKVVNFSKLAAFLSVWVAQKRKYLWEKWGRLKTTHDIREWGKHFSSGTMRYPRKVKAASQKITVSRRRSRFQQFWQRSFPKLSQWNHLAQKFSR